MATAIYTSYPTKRNGLLRCARNDGSICHGLNWQIPLLSLFLMIATANRSECQSLTQEVKAAPNISQLVPLELHSGSNDVMFWGTRPAAGGDVPFHHSGKIYQFETEGILDTYYATMQWKTPSFLLPLEDEIPSEGEDSVGAIYVGNMDLFDSGATQQHVAFFQGFLNGMRQTFFVRATISFSTYPPKASPANIDIYGFWGGSEPADFSNPPGFRGVEAFVTASTYCDAKYAMLSALSVVPPPSQQHQNHQITAAPASKPQHCQ